MTTVLRRSWLLDDLIDGRGGALRFFDSGEIDGRGVARPGRGYFGVKKDDFVGDGVRRPCGDVAKCVRSSDPSSCEIDPDPAFRIFTTLDDPSGIGEEGTLDKGDEPPEHFC